MSGPSDIKQPASPQRTTSSTSVHLDETSTHDVLSTYTPEKLQSLFGSLEKELPLTPESNKPLDLVQVSCVNSDDSNREGSKANIRDKSEIKTKRPISYPCGSVSNPEVPVFNTAKRNSDPPKPVSISSSIKSNKAQVKPFTKESLERLERKTVQLVREYGFQPRRKLSVEDGSRLPVKYEPFPSNLYGRPLEEIDNFIYDEVKNSSSL